VALETLAADLDPARFRTLVQSLDGAGVDLAMPRFGCAASAELKEPLTALGIGPAFDPSLDRPFLLAITDQETGTVLFLGQMEDPNPGGK
jgi:serine protease inhibitor